MCPSLSTRHHADLGTPKKTANMHKKQEKIKIEKAKKKEIRKKTEKR
jgi:hypothetical protein